jgi:hypothetical protein
MTTKSTASWRRSGAGLTLIEVVAGLALLGGLLVTILLARGRFVTRGRDVDRSLEACRLADELLERWWQDRRKIPRNGAGEIPGRYGWRWRTRIVDNEDAADLGARAVAVEILPPREGSDDGEPSPAARVEILLPTTVHRPAR